MLEKYNRYKILKIFMDSPTENLRLREISKLAKVSPPSVMNYLKEFEKENLVKRKIKNGIPFYTASRDEPNFSLYKKLGIIFELNKSGLVDYIWEKLSPEAIVLFGSYARGESVEGSDVDLFILGKESRLEIGEFEKKLNKRVHIIFKESLKDIAKELRNNILNGIILKGYIEVF